MAESSDTAIALALLAFGATGLIFGIMQWKGVEFTEFNPFFFFATVYLLLVPAGIGISTLAIAVLIEAWLGLDSVATVMLAIGAVLNLVGVVLKAWQPKWLRPAWQRSQMEWWIAEEEAGRGVRWRERPDHVRFGPGVIQRRIDALSARYRKAHLDLDQITDTLHGPNDQQPTDDDPTDPRPS